jgi:hypothetical protein
MTNLVAPYRHPPDVAEPLAPFNPPLYRTAQEAYYGKGIQQGVVSGMANSRQVSGTFALKNSANAPTWAKAYEFGSGTDTVGGVFYISYHNTNHTMYLVAKILPNTNIYTFTFPPLVNDGVLRRFAFNLDLDDIANSEYSINGVKANFSGTATADNIRWSEVTQGAVYCGNNNSDYWNFTTSNTDGIGMVSFSSVADLDLDAVFDGSGYFTDPGKHFLNWYATRPMLGMISAPHHNQGHFHWLSGQNYNHSPSDTWDFFSPDESRHFKYMQPPGTAGRVNEGITY